jgi:hypothetical protein
MINETLFHAEESNFRAVTGGAYNIPNAYGEIMKGSSFPAKGTIPIAVTHVGTFSSEGKAVRGTGTSFTNLIQNSFLYNGDVLRKIDYVVSDTLLFLKQEFPANATDLDVLVCERQFFKMVMASNSHASEAATLQEAPLAAQDRQLTGGAPFSYDASGGGELSFNMSR